ncbi:MAG: hypothetical protein HFH11_09475 [Dorea sp.]|nr:hypothetical protein [Dorea sp.]
MEDLVSQKYQAVYIAASFPAENMYLKRGYRIKTYEKIKTECGDHLCYHTMEKIFEDFIKKTKVETEIARKE